jgi:hypothetical protein
MLKTDANACFISWCLVLKFNFNPNETPGWKWHCLVYVEWLLGATCMVDLTMACGIFPRVSTLVVCHPGTKRPTCLPCLVSFQCSLMTIWALSWLSMLWGFIHGYWQKVVFWARSDPDGWMSFWKVLSHSSLWVEWVLRWKCTTPAGCQTNRLAMSPVMDNLSS